MNAIPAPANRADSATTSSERFDLAAAPMRVGTVRLKARDAGRVADFYAAALGLVRHDGAAGTTVLGSPAAPLIEIAGDAALAPRDPRAAGLFHTAFRLPSRADLARWMIHARDAGLLLQGASDHVVSEAIYLADPEGNGIEVYADRPPAGWRGEDGEIHMTTAPLDIRALLATAGNSTWRGFPDGGTVGHIHLQVGDTDRADRFYRDVLGFDVADRYPGASFFGSGGYHHQIAGNVWNSRGAGRRPAAMAGLDGFELVLREEPALAALRARVEAAGLEIEDGDGGAVLRDPWGIAIGLRT